MGVPSKCDHGAVNSDLVFGVHVNEGFKNFAVHGGHRIEHALAAIALFVAIAEFHGFVSPGGSAGWHGRTAEGTIFENDVHLNGWVAAAVKNFASGNVKNGGHGALRMKSVGLMTWTRVQCKKAQAGFPNCRNIRIMLAWASPSPVLRILWGMSAR